MNRNELYDIFFNDSERNRMIFHEDVYFFLTKCLKDGEISVSEYLILMMLKQKNELLYEILIQLRGD